MHISMVSCQKGPTRHAYAWQIGPFWQDTLDITAYYDQVEKFYNYSIQGTISTDTHNMNM